MIVIPIANMNTTVSFEEIEASGFFVEDEDKLQVMHIHALEAKDAPNSMDYMAEGALLFCNRGFLFCCARNPKSGAGVGLSRGVRGATAYAAGALGGLVYGAIDGLNYQAKLKKSLENPHTFHIPFNRVVGIGTHKIGGIFGKLKDLILQITVVAEEGGQSTYWIEAYDRDEAWPTLITQAIFLDVAQNYMQDLIESKLGKDWKAPLVKIATEKLESDLPKHITKNGDPVQETKEFKEKLSAEMGDLVGECLRENGFHDGDLDFALENRLREFEGIVDNDLYEAVMNS